MEEYDKDTIILITGELLIRFREREATCRINFFTSTPEGSKNLKLDLDYDRV